MKTKVIKINDIALQSEDIQGAASIIKSGGLVVIPTETVYGLGGDGTNAGSAEKIYAAKGRPSDNPLIIHICEPSDAEKYAYTNEIYYKLAKSFMPGPLTVVLKKKDTIPFTVTGGLKTVAVRCPSHPVAREVIKASGVPIAAPSANISGKPSPTCAEHVICDLDGKVDMILDGGECDIGLESTIVMINDDGGLTLLRPGGITYDALCCVCDNVKISPSIEGVLSENEHPLSPGMKYKHYAPDSPLVLLDGESDRVLDFLIDRQSKEKALVLCYNDEAEYLSDCIVLPIGERGDAAAHAKRLFSALREADKYSPGVIYAHKPDKSGLGMALYNRMIRAAAHTVKHIE